MYKITDCSPKIREILNLASNIHEDVNQLFDGQPYYVHLKAVLLNAMEFMQYFPKECEQFRDVIAFGACFHDTIEDARLTCNDVLKIARNMFNDEYKAYMAAEIVYALTNEKGRTRAERANDKYYEGIRCTPFAAFIKFCDRYANTSYAHDHGTSMYKKYCQEFTHFKEVLIDLSETNYMLGVPYKLIEAVKDLSQYKQLGK
jgi:hypothetical protein